MEQTEEEQLPDVGVSDDSFRTLLEATADGVLVLRQGGAVLYANPAALTLLGRKANDLAAIRFGSSLSPGTITEVELPNGATGSRFAEMRVDVTSWKGQPALLASLRDITERKQMEQSLRFLAQAGSVLSESLILPRTLESIAELAVSHLADWCVIDVLESDTLLRRVAVAHVDSEIRATMQPLLGCFAAPPSATPGLAEVFRDGHGRRYDRVPEGVWDSLAPKPEDRYVLQKLGGHSLMIVPLPARERILGTIALVATKPGRCYGLADLHLADELARRSALAVENARLYDESQEAVRSRNEFLAMLAHELRNPLGPIVNAGHILSHLGLADPRIERAVKVVQRQSAHLAHLLDDLLDVARVTRGKIELHKQQIDLATTLSDALQSVRIPLEERRHTLVIDLPPEPVLLEADATRLDQILINLLDNAIKYTSPDGRIEVAGWYEGPDVVLRVSDNGVGIAPDKLARVFELFLQLQPTLDRAHGGLGVGLTLVKNLVELHGGSVSVHSAGLGQGSAFTVRLPRGHQPGTETQASPKAKAQGRRILLIEDNIDSQAMLGELLRMWGHEVEAAPEATLGLKLAASWRPEVVVIDIGLPGLDGYHVARELRAAEGTRTMVLIALTGYSQPEDRRRAFEAGFDAFLVKPMNTEELARLLTEKAHH